MKHVIYLVHSKEFPEERDHLFQELSKAEAYVCESGMDPRDFQIKAFPYELSPTGVRDVMGLLRDFYLQQDG